MEFSSDKNLIFIRLFPGEDIFASLREACKREAVETAVVVSGLGQLVDFSLGYFKEKGDYAPEGFSEPHELVALSGIISKHDKDYNFHLHAALSDKEKKLVGGHLIKGSVSVTNEIVLLKSKAGIKRRLEEKTGLLGMFFE